MSYIISDDLQQRFYITDLKSCKQKIELFVNLRINEIVNVGFSQKRLDDLDYWIRRFRVVKKKLEYEIRCKKLRLLDDLLCTYKKVTN